MINFIKVFRRRILMRFRILRYRLKMAHPHAYLAPGVRPSRDIVMKPYSFINVGCIVGPGVELGRYSMLGPRVMMVGNDHVFDKVGVPIIFSGRPESDKTIVGDDAWIGAGAIVMAGVRIGNGAIVGAGCVVTKDVPDYEIHVGVPNVKVGCRFDDEEISTHNKMLLGDLYEGDFCPRQ